jgi:hypothetical protein
LTVIVWPLSFGRYRLAVIVWPLSFDRYRLAVIVWPLSFGRYRLAIALSFFDWWLLVTSLVSSHISNANIMLPTLFIFVTLFMSRK